jgi:hypothetical protein
MYWDFGFEWFSRSVILLYSYFDRKFSPVVSADGCRLIKLNYLNL